MIKYFVKKNNLRKKELIWIPSPGSSLRGYQGRNSSSEPHKMGSRAERNACTDIAYFQYSAHTQFMTPCLGNGAAHSGGGPINNQDNPSQTCPEAN